MLTVDSKYVIFFILLHNSMVKFLSVLLVTLLKSLFHWLELGK